ncbi:hypothetical protein M2T70_16365 [Elizabethkingia anophelis]|uniref:hypothetical protein n=1 Tax=Elizabethkingia anophelis TaxID=1117645 RepID=UPI000995D4AE|nr:hypothetical protein [Elizabethkingia anophelis]AQW97241.1 hypothetical protein BBD31_04765 [Elizabethkingia anophelis]AQX87837.1 hypothetical protein AYC67_01835 [Elizabethkingia anophelis]ASV80379.1 hypothetical protein A6J37_18210 [Elizabethkingia anophelis]EHM7982518.1 hypothetical protein [Elizabethkingia anophelis]EHM8033701.1 hypothetical protein [Elizabethkingia anophelis]
MKTLIIFFIVLVGIFCKSQEINDRKIDIMIKSLSEEISLLDNNFFEISNTSDSNYLINRLGFRNIKSTVFENGEEYAPYTFINSHPTQWGINECKNYILLIPKHSNVKTNLLLDIVPNSVYKFNDQNKYSIFYESEHTARAPYRYGCKQYVDSLVAKGYRIYEGTIKDTKPLITEYSK